MVHAPDLPRSVTNANIIEFRLRWRRPLQAKNMHCYPHSINIEALLAHVPLFNELATDEVARLARGGRRAR